MVVTQSSVAEEVHAATSARVADKCNRVWGQKLSEEEERLHDDLARDAREKGLVAWKNFEVFETFGERDTTGGSSRYQMVACMENDPWRRRGPD